MKAFLITSLLAAFALAQPHGHNHFRRAHPHRRAVSPAAEQPAAVEKRDIKTQWVTETAWVTVTEYVRHTKTEYLGKPQATKDAQFHESQPKTTAAPKVEAPPAAAAPAPQLPAPVQPAPVVNSPAPAPVVETPAASPPERGSGASGGSTGGYDRAGQMTYYNVGLGACGWNDAGKGQSDYIVALNAPVMGAQSNGNPYCGKKVEISYNGKTIVAEVRDKCPECAPGDLDVSEGAFVALCGGTGAGRVSIQWKFL